MSKYETYFIGKSTNQQEKNVKHKGRLYQKYDTSDNIIATAYIFTFEDIEQIVTTNIDKAISLFDDNYIVFKLNKYSATIIYEENKITFFNFVNECLPKKTLFDCVARNYVINNPVCITWPFDFKNNNELARHAIICNWPIEKIPQHMNKEFINSHPVDVIKVLIKRNLYYCVDLKGCHKEYIVDALRAKWPIDRIPDFYEKWIDIACEHGYYSMLPIEYRMKDKYVELSIKNENIYSQIVFDDQKDKYIAKIVEYHPEIIFIIEKYKLSQELVRIAVNKILSSQYYGNFFQKLDKFNKCFIPTDVLLVLSEERHIKTLVKLGCSYIICFIIDLLNTKI